MHMWLLERCARTEKKRDVLELHQKVETIVRTQIRTISSRGCPYPNQSPIVRPNQSPNQLGSWIVIRAQPNCAIRPELSDEPMSLLLLWADLEEYPLQELTRLVSILSIGW
eukprot:TRINITY_DN36038_c0_g1_i1.p1 TRINITY_DN36038_c0_g1~~TRINITY_DN36038_c0_g1_i1.p1  ORF type:complete len:111 (+),score=7.32 TRINITY_DN36038_c0_g1_i1:42-374(+)